MYLFRAQIKVGTVTRNKQLHMHMMHIMGIADLKNTTVLFIDMFQRDSHLHQLQWNKKNIEFILEKHTKLTN